MTDEAGNFYEVAEGQLRCLGELVRDERGKFFEVLGTSKNPVPQGSKQKPQRDPVDPDRNAVSSIGEDTVPAKTPPRAVPAQSASGETSSGYRKLVADPGLYMKAAWGSINTELVAQVKHPERLCDAEEIEFYAQVYEAQRTMPAARLAALELGDSALHSRLRPLTREKARMLGVPHLFKPARHPFETRASARQIHPGQRLYRLSLVYDPTAEREPQSDGASASERESEQVPQRQIPEQYLNPQHFKYSREEVLYDMKEALGTPPPEVGALACWFLIYPMRSLKGLWTSVLSKGRMKKWRAMLAGKSLEDQLWGVSPPRGFPHHPAVRRWAEATLAQSGHDPVRMLVEWEIFWRRKGCN